MKMIANLGLSVGMAVTALIAAPDSAFGKKQAPLRQCKYLQVLVNGQRGPKMTVDTESYIKIYSDNRAEVRLNEKLTRYNVAELPSDALPSRSTAAKMLTQMGTPLKEEEIKGMKAWALWSKEKAKVGLNYIEVKTRDGAVHTLLQLGFTYGTCQ